MFKSSVADITTEHDACQVKSVTDVKRDEREREWARTDDGRIVHVGLLAHGLHHADAWHSAQYNL